jgi:quercetin dioxygenase-like cupin family protein
MQVEVLERVNTAVSACVTREQIMGLQDAMFAKLQEMGLPHTPGNTDELCPVTHHHAPGLYAREIFIPAGVLIVGKIHKHSHVNTISKGRVIVATEFGTQELVAPVTFVSVPGTKRAVVAQEDTIWTTYHPTEETDLAKIEEEVIAPDFLAYEQWRLSK